MDIVPYQPFYRDDVRRIACDTADAGQPVEHFFSDREFIADMVTAYYTDYEPVSTYVALHESKVIGYITGCLNSDQFDRKMTWPYAPQALLALLFRGGFFRKETWLMMIAAVKTALVSGHYKKKFHHAFPAHFHINLDRAFRGQHFGEALITTFFCYMRQNGIRGVHVAARVDNIKAIRFFLRMGFEEKARHTLYLPHKDRIAAYTIAVLCQNLT